MFTKPKVLPDKNNSNCTLSIDGTTCFDKKSGQATYYDHDGGIYNLRLKPKPSSNVESGSTSQPDSSKGQGK